MAEWQTRQTLTNLYEKFKKYGPYGSKKDKRLRLVLVDENQKKTTVSYPKYLMEIHLNRYLIDNETVHHIDGNFLNNDLENLIVLDQSTHSKIDAIKRKSDILTCQWCKKQFSVDGSKLRNRERKDRNANSFCSKKCTGQYGAYVQNSGLKLGKININKEYYKSSLEEIPRLNGVNSTNSNVEIL